MEFMSFKVIKPFHLNIFLIIRLLLTFLFETRIAFGLNAINKAASRLVIADDDRRRECFICNAFYRKSHTRNMVKIK